MRRRIVPVSHGACASTAAGPTLVLGSPAAERRAASASAQMSVRQEPSSVPQEFACESSAGGRCDDVPCRQAAGAGTDFGGESGEVFLERLWLGEDWPEQDDLGEGGGSGTSTPTSSRALSTRSSRAPASTPCARIMLFSVSVKPYKV